MPSHVLVYYFDIKAISSSVWPWLAYEKRAVTRHHQGQSANSSDDRHVVGSRSLHQVRWRHVSGVLVDNI